MENHKKILGIVYIVSAALHGLFIFAVTLLVSALLDYQLNTGEPEDIPVLNLIRVVLQFLPAIVIIVYILPSLIAGIGLLTKQKWALTMAMIVGCFKLLSFPIGTAVGIYGIWVYLEDKKLRTPA